MSKQSNLATTLFPLGFAEGPAFCNRENECDRLKKNILNGTHTYIVGIRQFGKTSLVRQVVAELKRKRSPKVHSHSIDLFTVHSIEALEALIREAVGTLSAQFLPKNKRVLGHLKTLFAAFKPELTVGEKGLSLRLFSTSKPASSIRDLLATLDEAAAHYNRRAVLIIDEFQQLSHIDKHRVIEGAIRNVAQGSRALSFVFLGSERSVLAQMFEAKKRPLFNSASERMDLERITRKNYSEFLRSAGKLKWGKAPSERVIDRILELTDRHTRYVNLLCRELWQQNKALLDKKVLATWEQLLIRERNQANQSLMALALAQRSVLQALSVQSTDKPTSKNYLGKFNIAGSTMTKSISVLIEKDYVRITSEGVYEVVDPLIKAIMKLTP